MTKAAEAGGPGPARGLAVNAPGLLPPGLDLLGSALALAARGWLVFPCVPDGKRPALRGNWQDLATADQDQVAAWWSRTPYNIGIACGPSRLVVVDLDMPRQAQRRARTVSGADALATLCERHGRPCPLPTYTVATPSGGRHLYYAAPAAPVRNSAGRLGPLIDVRASGGYVIGAGSRIGGRSYTVLEDRVPVPLPAWISVLACDDSTEPTGRKLPVGRGAQGTAYAMAALREETRLAATARPGTRNDTLNRAAFSLGQLAAAGLLPHLAVITALAAAAQEAGLPPDEARQTIRSGFKAGETHPRRALR